MPIKCRPIPRVNTPSLSDGPADSFPAGRRSIVLGGGAAAAVVMALDPPHPPSQSLSKHIAHQHTYSIGKRTVNKLASDKRHKITEAFVFTYRLSGALNNLRVYVQKTEIKQYTEPLCLFLELGSIWVLFMCLPPHTCPNSQISILIS